VKEVARFGVKDVTDGRLRTLILEQVEATVRG
jgi:hypothetical protein